MRNQTIVQTEMRKATEQSKNKEIKNYNEIFVSYNKETFVTKCYFLSFTRDSDCIDSSFETLEEAEKRYQEWIQTNLDDEYEIVKTTEYKI